MARKSTRAAQGSGTIRKRTVKRNGKEYTYWEARITIGRDPGTGKQRQKSFTGQTQKEVREKLQAATVSVNEGTYTEPSNLTVAEWADIWQNEYLISRKPNTRTSYKSAINKHIKPAFGAIKLNKVTPHAVQTFYNNLGKGTPGKKSLVPSSIRTTHAVLSSLFTQAVKLGYIKSNPCANCDLPRIDSREMTAMDENQAKLFLQAINGHKFEILYTVALFTGMREGELLGLTWDCVDFERGTITIDKQMQYKGNGNFSEREFTTTKSGKVRKISPAPWVMQLLKKHRAKQAEVRLLAGPLWEDYNLVFTNERGRYLLPKAVYLNLKGIAEKIGYPELRFHDLRHSYAIASIQSGDDIKTLQENLGHATATITLDVYAHVTEQMKQASAQRMDSYIKEVLGL